MTTTGTLYFVLREGSTREEQWSWEEIENLCRSGDLTRGARISARESLGGTGRDAACGQRGNGAGSARGRRRGGRGQPEARDRVSSRDRAGGSFSRRSGSALGRGRHRRATRTSRRREEPFPVRPAPLSLPRARRARSQTTLLEDGAAGVSLPRSPGPDLGRPRRVGRDAARARTDVRDRAGWRFRRAFVRTVRRTGFLGAGFRGCSSHGIHRARNRSRRSGTARSPTHGASSAGPRCSCRSSHCNSAWWCSRPRKS